MIDKHVAVEVRRQWASAESASRDYMKYDWEQDLGGTTGKLVCLRCGALALYEHLKFSGECRRIRPAAAIVSDN